MSGREWLLPQKIGSRHLKNIDCSSYDLETQALLCINSAKTRWISDIYIFKGESAFNLESHFLLHISIHASLYMNMGMLYINVFNMNQSLTIYIWNNNISVTVCKWAEVKGQILKIG